MFRVFDKAHLAIYLFVSLFLAGWILMIYNFPYPDPFQQHAYRGNEGIAVLGLILILVGGPGAMASFYENQRRK